MDIKFRKQDLCSRSNEPRSALFSHLVCLLLLWKTAWLKDQNRRLVKFYGFGNFGWLDVLRDIWSAERVSDVWGFLFGRFFSGWFPSQKFRRFIAEKSAKSCWFEEQSVIFLVCNLTRLSTADSHATSSSTNQAKHKKTTTKAFLSLQPTFFKLVGRHLFSILF